MFHMSPADSQWKITDKPLQSTYIMVKDEKQIEAAHTVKRKKTKRESLQDRSAWPEPAGAREKCDVSWDNMTLKAKAEGFVWSLAMQLHLCLAGTYLSGKTVTWSLSLWRERLWSALIDLELAFPLHCKNKCPTALSDTKDYKKYFS